MITAENILLVGSILIFTSILISKTGYRFGIPTLLLFLLVGMALAVTVSAFSSTVLQTLSLSA